MPTRTWHQQHHTIRPESIPTGANLGRRSAALDDIEWRF